MNLIKLKDKPKCLFFSLRIDLIFFKRLQTNGVCVCALCAYLSYLLQFVYFNMNSINVNLVD